MDAEKEYNVANEAFYKDHPELIKEWCELWKDIINNNMEEKKTKTCSICTSNNHDSFEICGVCLFLLRKSIEKEKEVQKASNILFEKTGSTHKWSKQDILNIKNVTLLELIDKIRAYGVTETAEITTTGITFEQKAELISNSIKFVTKMNKIFRYYEMVVRDGNWEDYCFFSTDTLENSSAYIKSI